MELKLTVDGLEKERDFYFSKLRDIELICQENESESSPILSRIIDILYATEVHNNKLLVWIDLHLIGHPMWIIPWQVVIVEILTNSMSWKGWGVGGREHWALSLPVCVSGRLCSPRRWRPWWTGPSGPGGILTSSLPSSLIPLYTRPLFSILFPPPVHITLVLLYCLCTPSSINTPFILPLYLSLSFSFSVFICISVFLLWAPTSHRHNVQYISMP